MVENKIIIDIELNDGSISQGILRAEGTAKRAGQRIGDELEDGIGEGFNRGFSGLNSKLRTAAGIFAGIFAGRQIISSFQGAIREASEFENQLVAVRTLLNDSSFSGQTLERGFASLTSGALDVFRELPVDIQNVNKALFDTVSAGVDAGRAIEVVRTAGQLATAGLTSISTATDGITTALNAFNISADESERVAAQFFTAQRLGKTTIDELSSSLGSAAAIAASSGVSFEELLAAVSAATTGGISTSSAFRGVRAAISNIATPTKLAQDAARRLGVEFNLAALESQGLAQFLQGIGTAANGNTQDLKDLFGSIEAFNTVASLAGNQSENFAEALKEISDTATSGQDFGEALSKSVNTAANQTKIFQNQLSALRIEIGNLLVPVQSFIQNGVIRLLEGFRNLASNQVVIDRLAQGFRLAAIALGLFVTRFAAIATFGVAVRIFRSISAELALIRVRANLAAREGVTGFARFTGAIVGTNIATKALRVGINLLKASATLGLTILIDQGIKLVQSFGGIRGFFEALPALAERSLLQVSVAFNNLGNFIRNNPVSRFLERRTGINFALQVDTSQTEARIKELDSQIDSLRVKAQESTTLPSALPQISPLGGDTSTGSPGESITQATTDKVITLAQMQSDALRQFVIANQDFVRSNREAVNELAVEASISTSVIDAALNSNEARLATFGGKIKGLVKPAKKAILDISNLVNQTLANGVSQGVAVMTNALLNGENAFKSFGSFVIGLLADFMIRVGQMAISVGIASLGVKAALQSLNGAVAIAAGAVLIALGTAFKSFAGGPSSGSAPTPSASSATAGGGGIAATPPTGVGAPTGNVAGISDTNAIGRQASIEVNIQGNVLDRRETALEIIEVLEEAKFAGIEVA